MVGVIIVISPADAASQEAVVDSTQRAVVARSRARRDAVVQQCLEYLGSYFRKLHHALRMRQLTSMDRSALWLTFPPRYPNSFVWLYTWPAASTLNVEVDSGIPFVCKHMILVLASDTVRPNAAHTTTITPIIFLSCSGDCETTPASST